MALLELCRLRLAAPFRAEEEDRGAAKKEVKDTAAEGPAPALVGVPEPEDPEPLPVALPVVAPRLKPEGPGKDFS